MDLIKPKSITIKDIDGDELTFNISRFPATVAREIITQYPVTAMPKMGDYQSNEALMMKVMKYVEAVKSDGTTIRLETKDLVDNHVTDADTLINLEYKALEYNTAVFNIGKISKSLGGFEGKVGQWISKTLIHSLGLSSAKKERPSKS